LFANTYLKSLDESKDLVQDVFVKLWEKDTQITSGATLKSFLYIMVRNACLNHLRQKAKEEKQIASILVSNNEAEFDQSVLEEDIHYRLYTHINLLGERSKLCVLFTLRGYSNQEIAEELNISINSVKTLKQRSYKFLRDQGPSIFQSILFFASLSS
jgi:RNA polymerase sigma-70 factor (ECF subfamily)